MDGICAIDLDTILPCLWVSKIRNKKRIYDAHELFCEMKEVASRPRVYRFWKKIEKNAVPQYKHAYTVNAILAQAFEDMYGSPFEVIRSIAKLESITLPQKEKFILYQGAVNEGRCFEYLIPAMKNVDANLIICGDGNFLSQTKKLVHDYGLDDKIIFKGMVEPTTLKKYTQTAYVGLTLFEQDSQNNYLSLANRFFDYIHAGTPQLCMNYPAYSAVNQMHQVAVLIDDYHSETIAKHLNMLLQDVKLWITLHQECMKARDVLCWQTEEKKLIEFYQRIFE